MTMDTLASIKRREPAISPNTRFGRLIAVSREMRARSGTGRRAFWKCVCDCGTATTVAEYNLKNGHSTSCGCLKREALAGARRTHAGRRLPEYAVWTDMKQRCGNPRRATFKHYGGRGITVCERWRENFAAFLIDMGRRPSSAHQIDRIDNDRGYEPGNCRWVLKAENVRNRRVSVRLTDEQVRAIRVDPRTQKHIAKDYGLQRHYVSMIKTGKVFSHVG